MSKIITCAAIEVANVNFYDETLYLRRDGSWFVSYADSISLTELSEYEAFEWLKRNHRIEGDKMSDYLKILDLALLENLDDAYNALRRGIGDDPVVWAGEHISRMKKEFEKAFSDIEQFRSATSMAFNREANRRYHHGR